VVADIAADAEPTSPPDRRPTSQDPRNRSASRALHQGRSSAGGGYADLDPAQQRQDPRN